MKINSGRVAAVKLLVKLTKNKSYSNILLDRGDGLSGLSYDDRQLALFLFHGTLKRRITLDYVLEKFYTKPLKKLDSEVHEILRCGAFSVLFSRNPDYAVVSEFVSVTKSLGKTSASGLVNAILRKVAKGKEDLLAEIEGLKGDKGLAVRYSCPLWLVKQLKNDLSTELEPFLIKSLQPTKTFIRVNTLKTTKEKLILDLESKGITFTPVENMENTGYIEGFRNLSRLAAHERGDFYVQDLSSQIAVESLGAEKDDQVIDLCCAPGGKSYGLAIKMENTGSIASFDISESRLGLVTEGAQRLGIENMTTFSHDATEPLEQYFGLGDKVLCDIPCSGFGVIGRRPEIKYKSKDEIEGLPKLQLEILNQAAKLVKEGGRLVYSTCTVLIAENSDVVTAFLKNNSDFELVENNHPLVLSESGMCTLVSEGYIGDGFFIATMRKISA